MHTPYSGCECHYIYGIIIWIHTKQQHNKTYRPRGALAYANLTYNWTWRWVLASCVSVERGISLTRIRLWTSIEEWRNSSKTNYITAINIITSIILRQFRLFILNLLQNYSEDGTTTKAIRELSLVINHVTQNRNPQGLCYASFRTHPHLSIFLVCISSIALGHQNLNIKHTWNWGEFSTNSIYSSSPQILERDSFRSTQLAESISMQKIDQLIMWRSFKAYNTT